MKKLFVFFFILTTVAVYAEKVLIITHNYNRPDFIELQYKTFKKFLHDDYEYIVFNDAQDNDLMNKIDAMCAHYNIKSIRIPQEIHSQPYLPRQPNDNLNRANIRHANCIQYSLDTIGFDHNGIVFIIDSDMFPIRPFSIADYMKDKDIAAFMNKPRGINYICPAFCILSMNKLPDKKTLNFNVCKINGLDVDSGGFTYYYLANHPELKVEHINVLYSHQLFLGDSHLNLPANNTLHRDTKIFVYERLGFKNQEIQFFLKQPDTFELYLNNHFLHYRGGSNHTGESQNYVDNKSKLFNEFFDNILK